MNYLWTKYLFYKFIDDEKIYLYNFRNGKDFFLSKEEFETKKFKDDNEFHFLVSNEFLVDSNVDELSEYIANAENEVLTKHKLELTIIPTSIGKYVNFMNLGYCENSNENLIGKSAFQNSIINRNSISLILKIFYQMNLENLDVLDLGCGRCGAIYTIQRMYKSCRLYGIDICKNGLLGKITNNELIICDFQNDIPFESDSFNLVYSIEVFHVITYMDKALQNIYRVLKRGGEFIIADAFTSNKCQSILEYAKKVGFTLLRICDITKNVLQSCKAISKNRIEVLGKSYREMIGAPGSSFFTQMENGILRYKVFYFTKKNE